MISRRVNGERAVILGWSRAILLQLAHPLMAAAVTDHSTFRGGVLAAARRLHHTIRAMRAVTFGDAIEQARAIGAIRTIHARVHGHLRTAAGPFAAGTPYSAADPDLVCWVHVTLADSVMRVYEMFVAPLTEVERDAFCGESAGVAVELGARPDDVPRTAVALARLMDAELHSGRLVVGADARALASAVLRPSGGVPGGPLVWLNRMVTVGLLPEPIRGQYGYAWRPRDAVRLRQAVRAVRTARRLLPSAVTRWSDAGATHRGDIGRPLFASGDRRP